MLAIVGAVWDCRRHKLYAPIGVYCLLSRSCGCITCVEFKAASVGDYLVAARDRQPRDEDGYGLARVLRVYTSRVEHQFRFRILIIIRDITM